VNWCSLQTGAALTGRFDAFGKTSGLLILGRLMSHMLHLGAFLGAFK